MIDPSPLPPSARLDRHLILALLLVALAVIPRSLLIARAHSETIDAEYHIARGLAYLTGTIGTQDLSLNDPPLGEALVSLPILATNLYEGRDPADARIYDESGRPERLAVRCAAWNSLLFLPLVAVLFVWCRRLYGLRAAWLTAALLAIEPNFAAHLSLTTLDVVGVSGIVIGCYCAWRYFERPTRGRLLAMGIATGVALMLKHTAVVLPLVIVAFAALWWVVKPWREGQSWGEWRAQLPGRLGVTVQSALVVVATILLLNSFELCPPKSPEFAAREVAPSGSLKAQVLRLEAALHFDAPWLGGTYLRAFRSGFVHGRAGHTCYLFGEERTTGWWYYFPAVATYKVPIGVAVILALGLLSLRRSSLRWEEWGLVLPLLAWALFMMKSNVNIGYRHFLPAYVFAMAAACRCLERAAVRWQALAWCALGAAGLHAASYHPDYLCYINFPSHKPYLAISDSNVDWGQGLKQARAWLDGHPQHGRPVTLHYFGARAGEGSVGYYLGDRVVRAAEDDPPPPSGLLIISPVYEAGPYVPPGAFAALQPLEPDAVIGHGLLVYDLDRLGRGAPFCWTDDAGFLSRQAGITRDPPR